MYTIQATLLKYPKTTKKLQKPLQANQQVKQLTNQQYDKYQTTIN